METEALEELLNRGLVGTGDGNWGLNSDVVSEVYRRLGAIYSIREILAKARALQSELRAIVKQELTGISLARRGEAERNAIGASFRQAMSVAGSITRFLSQRAEVLNRANEAAKQATTAGWTLGINAVLAAASYTSMGIGYSYNIAIATQLSNIGVALMNLVNIAFSLGDSIVRASSNLGYYENYNVKTSINRTGQVTQNTQTIDERLEQLKYDLMAQMHSGLITELSGGLSVVSAETANISTEMRGVLNMQEVLATVRSVASALRDEVRSTLGGRRAGEVTYGKESIENYEQVAMNILDSLKTGLSIIAQRRTQQSAAVRQVVMNSIQTALSLTAVILSVANAFKKAKVENMRQQNRSTDAQTINYVDANRSATTPVAQTAVSPAPQAGHVTAAAQPTNTAGRATAPANQPVTNHAAGDINTMSELEDQITLLTKVSAFVKLANVILGIVNLVGIEGEGVQYSQINQANRATRQISPAQANHGQAGAANASERGDVYSSMSNMETDVYRDDFVLADIQLHEEQHAQVLMRYNQLMSSVMSFLQEVPDLVNAFHKPDKSMVYGEVRNMITDTNVTPRRAAEWIVELPETDRNSMVEQNLTHLPDRARARQILQEVQTIAHERNIRALEERVRSAMISVQSPTTPQPVQQPVVVPSAPATTRQRTEALLAQAEGVQRQLNEATHNTAGTPAAQDLAGILARAEQAVQTPQTIDQLEELKRQLEAQRAALSTERDQVPQERQRLEAEQARLPGLRAGVAAAVNQLQEEERRIDREITQLRQVPETTSGSEERAAQCTTLERQRQQVNESRRCLQSGLETVPTDAQLGQRVAGIRSRLQNLNAQIARVSTTINRVDSAIQQMRTTPRPQTAAAAAVSQGENWLASFFGGRRTASEDRDTISTAAGLPSGLRRQSSDSDRHAEYLRQIEEHDKMMNSVGSITGGGVC